MKNLISMTDFVFKCHNEIEDLIDSENAMYDYAKFLKQPLELWMFVPCKLVDGVWVVLEYPKEYQDWCKWGGFSKHGGSIVSKCRGFHESKEKCLFDGFEVDTKHNGNKYISKKHGLIIFASTESDDGFFRLFSKFSNIESLIKYNLQLTATAQKQIGNEL